MISWVNEKSLSGYGFIIGLLVKYPLILLILLWLICEYSKMKYAWIILGVYTFFISFMGVRYLLLPLVFAFLMIAYWYFVKKTKLKS